MKKQLKDYIFSLPVIDTHEHIIPESECMGWDIDVFNLFEPYVCDNFLSSGVSEEDWYSLLDKSIDFKVRYNMSQAFIENIKSTTYFKAVMRVLKDNYGLKEISYNEFVAVSDRLKKENKIGLYEKIKKLNNIETFITYVGPNETEKYAGTGIVAVPTVSGFGVHNLSDIKAIGDYAGVNIFSFADFLKAADTTFARYNENGIKNIKFSGGYRRKLDYKMRSYHEAESVFNHIICHPVIGFEGQANYDEEFIKPLDDFMTHYMINLMSKYKMNAIFHIGLHAWNNNHVESCHSKYMEELIMLHKDVNFVILHCGMPFIHESVLLCKYFPNVYLNMTWCHIIDRNQSIELIKTCIEQLPRNKIHGFGGDYMLPQSIYGHLTFARENLALALSQMIENEFLDLDEAKELAKLFLYDNPKNFYM